MSFQFLVRGTLGPHEKGPPWENPSYATTTDIEYQHRELRPQIPTERHIGRGRWGNIGTLRNSVYHRLRSNKKVILLVLNATFDLCLSIAGVVFYSVNACPREDAKIERIKIIRWSFGTFVSVRRPGG